MGEWDPANVNSILENATPHDIIQRPMYHVALYWQASSNKTAEYEEFKVQMRDQLVGGKLNDGAAPDEEEAVYTRGAQQLSAANKIISHESIKLEIGSKYSILSGFDEDETVRLDSEQRRKISDSWSIRNTLNTLVDTSATEMQQSPAYHLSLLRRALRISEGDPRKISDIYSPNLRS